MAQSEHANLDILWREVRTAAMSNRSSLAIYLNYEIETWRDERADRSHTKCWRAKVTDPFGRSVSDPALHDGRWLSEAEAKNYAKDFIKQLSGRRMESDHFLFSEDPFFHRSLAAFSASLLATLASKRRLPSFASATAVPR